MGFRKKPLLAKDIINAQNNTRSGAEAARYLGVALNTYKKYAQMYGIYKQHKNPGGKHIKKHIFLESRKNLQDVLDNKYPFYNLKRLKDRLIAAGYISDKCSLCGFSEKRVADGKSPLQLRQKDGDAMNFKLDNLELLCLNCMFLTLGRVWIKLDKPNHTLDEKLTDIYNENNELILSPEEIENIRNDVLSIDKQE